MSIKINRNKVADELGRRISASTSPFHTVLYVAEELKDNGFEELILSEKWTIKKDGKYFVKIFDSTLAAFSIGEKWEGGNFRITAAHTDFPCLKIKPEAEISAQGCVRCNVEVYGGPILNTWLDRPLSAAGRIVIKSDNIMEPEIRYIDFKRPMFIIPHLAIHMNREVNKGIELNRQKDMLPVMFAGKGAEDIRESGILIKELADCAGVRKDDILDYELYIYPFEGQTLLGTDNSLYTAGRLDNMTSVQACIKGIIASANSDARDNGISFTIIYDSEEIGSGTKQGAGSVITRLVLERIYQCLGIDEEVMKCDIVSAIGLSVDVAHAVHPNVPEKSDLTNKLNMNQGFGIKTSAAERYASDIKVIGIVKQLCEKYGILNQRYVNRSDIQGGSTLGTIVVSQLPVRMLDIGVPILAMHSARETMGIDDQFYLEKIVEAFYKEV